MYLINIVNVYNYYKTSLIIFLLVLRIIFFINHCNKKQFYVDKICGGYYDEINKKMNIPNVVFAIYK